MLDDAQGMRRCCTLLRLIIAMSYQGLTLMARHRCHAAAASHHTLALITLPPRYGYCCVMIAARADAMLMRHTAAR